MKTTIEISDALLREARALAAREGVTLRTLVERRLHRVVAETKDGAPFKLRRASFKGKGRAELGEASWDTLRDLIYQDRGAIAVDTNILVYPHREDSPLLRSRLPTGGGTGRRAGSLGHSLAVRA